MNQYNDRKKTLFSVCILSYKNIEKIEESVKSVYLQNNIEVELVISDDCSYENKEKTYKHLEKTVEPYRDRFKRIILNVNSERMGTVKHLNSVLSMLSGDYYCLLGSGDCLYTANVLENVVNHMEEAGSLLCTSKKISENSEGKKKIMPGKRVVRAYSNQKRLLALCCREVNYIYTIGTFFKSDLFMKYGGFDESYYLLEDAPFFLNLLFDKEYISFYDEITCYYAPGGVSNKKKMNPLLEKDSIRTLTDIKYPRRGEVDFLTRRIIEFKYEVRLTDSVVKKVLMAIKYPDAAIYMVAYWLVYKTRIINWS